MTAGPPARLFRLLQRLLPDSIAESLVGDLEESFHADLRRGLALRRARRRVQREALRALLLLAGRRAIPVPRATGVWSMSSLLRDLRYALRSLARAPGFTALAVLVVALGVGATTAIFSVVNPVLFQPLPYPHPDRLVVIWERDPDGSESNTGFATYADVRQRSRSLEQVAVMATWQPTLSGRAEPERLNGNRVSASYFDVLGVQPMLGRGFLAEEDQRTGPPAVILGYGLWNRRFGGDSGIVGQPIDLGGVPYEVVGVMGPGFDNVLDPGVQIWSPLRYDTSLPWACRTCRHLQMVARLHPDIPLARADRELQAISTALVREHPTEYRAPGFSLVPLQLQVTRGTRPVLLTLLAAVALVLLIACANVMHLLLARAARRQGEFALRAALGAGRGRLVRQLLTESLVLALAGGLAGVGLAWMTLHSLLALAPASLPRLGAVRLDGPVLGFALGLTATTGLLFGLAPALVASRSRLHTEIQQDSRRLAGSGRRGRRALVVSEVALATVLLLGAGLLLRSLNALIRVDPGFDPTKLLTMEVSLTGPRYQEDAADRAFFGQAGEAVRAVPGVRQAAFTTLLPLGGNYDRYGVHIQDRPNPNPENDPDAMRYAVTPGYLETMRIPVLRGRGFTEQDREGAAPVALISQTMARTVWPGEDPIGKRVSMSLPVVWRTIVGIVGDVHHDGLDQTPTNQIYVPESQWPWAASGMTLVLRAEGDPAALAPAVRRAIWSVDPTQAIARVATMDALIQGTAAQRTFALRLFGIFAVLAVVLAGAGIYGALSGSVAERTRELGIRLALGASRRDLLRLVLGEGAALIVLGLLLGLAAAAGLSRLIASLLYGVGPHDPVSQLLVAGLFLVLGLAAALAPAWRATRLDPMTTLRVE